VETFTKQKPWHEKIQLDPSFPFRLWDGSSRSFPLHWHDFLEVIHLLEGKMQIYIDGTVFEGRKGDIVIVNSGMVHGYSSNEPEYRKSIFQFGLDFFDRYLVEPGDVAVQKLIFDRKTFISQEADHELHQKLENLLLSIRREYFQKEDGFHMAIKSRLYELALLFIRDLPAKMPLPREVVKHNYNRQILGRVMSFIYSNSGNPGISLEHAADAAALSKFYFTRFFKEQTGQTFHTYLSQVRINRAKEYLADSDLPVTEIAYLCGFSSIKTFNRLFKAFTGSAPSSYR